MRTKIAFLILAHDDPAQLSRLCRALGHNDDILVHLDKRSPLSFFDSQHLDSNVKFVRRRIPVFWGDFSVVEATLILIEEAMRSKADYLRLVLLSGSCYPIKNVEELRNYFMNNEDHINIRYVNILEYQSEPISVSSSYNSRNPWISAYKRMRRENRYLEFLDKAARKLISIMLKVTERGSRAKFPGLTRHIAALRARADPWAWSFRQKFPELIPYVGSQFWSITPECARIIQQFVRNNPDFLEFHKYSFAPDEHFFHTIIGNSEFSARTDGIVKAEGINLSNLHAQLNNLHAPRSPVVTIDHLDAILASDNFFVRKATTGKSDRLLDYLDEHVLAA